LRIPSSSENINRINKPNFNTQKSKENYYRTNNRQQNRSKQRALNCFRCGEKFDRNHKTTCKAMGKKCYNCDKMNHFSKCCKLKKEKPVAQNIDQEQEGSETETEGYESFAVSPKQRTESAKIKVENVEIKMIIDSGSSINIIDKDTFEKIKKRNKNLVLSKNIKTKIFPYASKPLKTLGHFQATLETENKISSQKVFVVDHNTAGNLLGIHAAKQLDLILLKEQRTNFVNNVNNRNDKIKNSIVEEFSDVFTGRGKLKNFQCKLYVKKDVKPGKTMFRC